MAKSVLFFTIPVPVVAIIAIWFWLQIDKNSEVRRLVDSKVERFVAGEKIASLENQIKANKAIAEIWKIITEAREKQIALEEKAKAEFEDALISSDQENFLLQERLNEIAKIKSACDPLSDGLYDRLQYK